MIRVLIVAFMVLLAREVQARSCENMQLQTGQTNIDFTSNLNTQGSFTVKADTRDGTCDFFIVFDYGSEPSYSSRNLQRGPYEWPFQVYKTAAQTSILKRLQDAQSENDVLSGRFSNSSNDAQVTVPYWAVLDNSNPWLRYGNYFETLTARLYRGTLNNYSYVDSRVISFNYNAPKRADISVTSSGGSFNLNDTTETMNFENLTPGASRSSDIILKYNAGYVLYISSTHNSRMKHATEDQYIPYSVRINGSSIDLSRSASSPAQLYRIFGTSPSSGTVLPVQVTIGNFGTMRSGSYTDTIQLTVQSAE